MENQATNDFVKGQLESMDERSMIREQDRLVHERKRKKNRRKRRIVSVVILFLAVGSAWYLLWGKSYFTQEEENAVVITASSGQEILYVRLDSVKGNEISYTIAQKVDTQENREDTQSSLAGTGSSLESSDAENPAGVRENRRGTSAESMPDRSQIPQDIQSNHENVGGFAMEGMGDTQGLTVMTGDRDGDGTIQSINKEQFINNNQIIIDNATYKLTEQTATAQIPVGTEVTTKLGTITTFSRLAAGDYVALVVENGNEDQVITSVYIVG